MFLFIVSMYLFLIYMMIHSLLLLCCSFTILKNNSTLLIEFTICLYIYLYIYEYAYRYWILHVCWQKCKDENISIAFYFCIFLAFELHKTLSNYFYVYNVYTFEPYALDLIHLLSNFEQKFGKWKILIYYSYGIYTWNSLLRA